MLQNGMFSFLILYLYRRCNIDICIADVISDASKSFFSCIELQLNEL